MRFLFFFKLFPLNSSHRLRGQVIQHAVNAFDLGGDSGGDLVEYGIEDKVMHYLCAGIELDQRHLYINGIVTDSDLKSSALLYPRVGLIQCIAV